MGEVTLKCENTVCLIKPYRYPQINALDLGKVLWNRRNHTQKYMWSKFLLTT